jgi:hypothetical protein
MFFKTVLALLTTASLILSTSAGAAGECNTGVIQCCQSLHQSQCEVGSLLAGLVGANIQDVNADVGFNCSPLSVAAVDGGADWYVDPDVGGGLILIKIFFCFLSATQPVCCEENHYGQS